MRSQRIESFLRKLQVFRALAQFVQLAGIFACVLVGSRVAANLSEAYLFDARLAVWLVLTLPLLWMVSRILMRVAENRSSRLGAEIDSSHHLKERLTTYLELRNSQHPFLSALIEETETKLESLSPLRIAQLQRGAAAVMTLLVLLLIGNFAIPFLPVPAAVASRKEQQKQVLRETKKLQEAVKKLASTQKDLELQKLLREFERQAAELQKNSAGKAEAVKKLHALQETWDKKTDELIAKREQSLRDAIKSATGTSKQDPRDDSGSELPDQNLADLEKALSEQQAPQGGKEGAAPSKPSREQQEQLRKALSDYEQQQKEAQNLRAEIQKELAKTREGITGAKPSVITDSRLKDRDLEKSKGGVEDGPGTTDKDIGPQSFDTAKKGKGEYVEDRTKADYQQLYEGQRESVGKDPLFLDSRWGREGNPEFTKVRTFGAPSDSTLENSSVTLGPQKQGEAPIRKEKIPASYQKIVRKYFESLNEQE